MAENRNRSSRFSYAAMRLLSGSLLMVAGFNKFCAYEPVLLARSWVIPTAIVAVWAVAECLIGFAVLTFVSHRSLRYTLVFLFAIFTVLLSAEWFYGAIQCRCLGISGLSVVGMLVLDTVILLSLVCFRRDWDEPSDLPNGLFGAVCSDFRYVLPALLLTMTAFFGSPQAGVSYLAGKNVVTNTTDKFAGHISFQEESNVVFKLRNVSSCEISLIGAETSCGCVATDDLPLTIQPFEHKQIRVRVRAGSTAGLKRETAQMIFNDSTSHLVLSVTALVHPNP